MTYYGGGRFLTGRRVPAFLRILGVLSSKKPCDLAARKKLRQSVRHSEGAGVNITSP